MKDWWARDLWETSWLRPWQTSSLKRRNQAHFHSARTVTELLWSWQCLTFSRRTRRRWGDKTLLGRQPCCLSLSLLSSSMVRSFARRSANFSLGKTQRILASTRTLEAPRAPFELCSSRQHFPRLAQDLRHEVGKSVCQIVVGRRSEHRQWMCSLHWTRLQACGATNTAR